MTTSSTIKEIEDRMEYHQSYLTKYQNELEEARGQQFFKCGHCEKRTKINKLTLIKEYWYVQPSGCTGGDYWKFSEYHVVCTKCNKATRVYDRSRYNDDDGIFKFVRERVDQFNEILEWHPENSGSLFNPKVLDLNELRKINKERNRGY